MNILFVTGHPAQIHNFKLMKFELESRGHHVFWLATNKDISKYLLNHYNINHSLLLKPKKTFFSKFITLIRNTIITIRFIKRNKIDISFSRISPYVSIASFLLRKTHFALTDTETAKVYDKFFGSFVSVLFTSKSYKHNLRKDQIRLDANIELFYLHPNRFKSEINVYQLLKIPSNEPYVLLRFVSWDAYHDKGLSGFGDSVKTRAVKEFSKYARVFISSEKDLPPYLSQYQIKTPPEVMHDILANAILFFGESATMASESAILGTPAIYFNENWLGYTSEEEDYGLLFSFKGNELEQNKAVDKGVEILKNINLKEEMEKHRLRFLANKIDITAFMIWFIEYYPNSKKMMFENPNFQYNFK